MDCLSILTVILTVIIASVNAGEDCVTERHYQGWYYTYEYEYCHYGCCDTYPNHTCCGAHVWIIIVSIIGAIIFISCIVAVICCVVKKKGRPGMVVQPGQTAQVSVVSAHNNMGYQQPVYSQPGYQQPAYSQPGYQQPGYSQPGNAPQPVFPQPGLSQAPQSGPAYPPPPAYNEPLSTKY